LWGLAPVPSGLGGVQSEECSLVPVGDILDPNIIQGAGHSDRHAPRSLGHPPGWCHPADEAGRRWGVLSCLLLLPLSILCIKVYYILLQVISLHCVTFVSPVTSPRLAPKTS
jgi:hypothetical protein